MTGILADHNLVGHVAVLVQRFGREPWPEFWAALGLRVLALPDLGLNERTPDDVIWRRCQADGSIPVTANRNHDGPDSLEAAIRAEGSAASLPVFTIGSADDLFRSRDYLERVARKFMTSLHEMDNLRGTGRLFLP